MKVTEHPSYGFVEKWLKQIGANLIETNIDNTSVDFVLIRTYRIGLSLDRLMFSTQIYGFIVPDSEEKFLQLMRILEPNNFAD